MSATQPTSQQAALVDAESDQTVTLLPLDKDAFCMKAFEVIEACKRFETSSDYVKQVGELAVKLAKWTQDHKDALFSAHVSFNGGEVLLVAMQKAEERDNDLVKALTDLDLEVARADEFDKVRFEVLSVPRASDEAVSTFLATETSIQIFPHAVAE